jgi:outer membrane protein assembly factor BamB
MPLHRLHFTGLGSLIALVMLLPGCGVDDNLSASERTNYENETSTNWSMSRGYPRNTAFNPFEQELAPDTVSNLQEVWHVDSTAPSLIQHADQIFSSTGQAYGTHHGTMLWAVDTLANPVFNKGLVFGTGSAIQGYSPGTGTAAPNYTATGGDATTQFGVPTAKDSSIVFAAVTDPSASDAASGPYVTYDVSSNQVSSLSLSPSLALGGLSTLAPAALTAGQLYAPGIVPVDGGGLNYVVFAATFGSSTGAKRKEWATVIDTLDPSAPAQPPELGVMVINARVFGASAAGDAVFALDQRSGALAWRTPAVVHIASLAATFDYVYAAGSDVNGQLVVQAFATGSGKGRFAVKLGAAQLTGQLAVGGDVLYVGTSAGELVALDATDGTIAKRVQLDGMVGDPLVTGGQVITTTGDRIVAVGLPPTPTPAP